MAWAEGAAVALVWRGTGGCFTARLRPGVQDRSWKAAQLEMPQWPERVLGPRSISGVGPEGASGWAGGRVHRSSREGDEGSVRQNQGPVRCYRPADARKRAELSFAAAAQQATPSNKITYINQADVFTLQIGLSF